MNEDALTDPEFTSTTTTTTTVDQADVPPRGRQIQRQTKKVGVVPAPVYLEEQNRLVIPVVHGVDYTVGEEVVTGSRSVDGPVTVEAKAREGYELPEERQDSWTFGK